MSLKTQENYFFKGGGGGMKRNKEKEAVAKTKQPHPPKKWKKEKSTIHVSLRHQNQEEIEIIGLINWSISLPPASEEQESSKSGVCWQGPPVASQYQYERKETSDWRAEIHGSGWTCEVLGMGLICEIQGLKFKVWGGLICETELSRFEF